MADNENLITVVGRIGLEPELRTTANGQEVLNFDVATNERKRAADGTWSDGPTSWFKVAAWNRLGRNAQLSFHRGQRVVVHGVLRVSEFQLQSGGRSRNVELTATALGHDLAWGTSTFVDGGRAAVQQQQWAAPEREPESEPSRELETVAASPAADWSSSLAQVDDTPFLTPPIDRRALILPDGGSGVPAKVRIEAWPSTSTRWSVPARRTATS